MSLATFEWQDDRIDERPLVAALHPWAADGRPPCMLAACKGCMQFLMKRDVGLSQQPMGKCASGCFRENGPKYLPLATPLITTGSVR